MDKSVLSSGTAAKVSTDEQGRPAVLLNIKDKDLFYDVTTKISQSSDKLIVIWLDFNEMEDSYKTAKCGSFTSLNDAKCLSAATVSQGFSSNVIIQGNVYRVCKCNTMEDICFGAGKCLFVWSDTPQGNNFWSDFLTYKTPTLTNSSVAADLNDVYKKLK
jgi:hypothetical protein